MHAQSDCCVLVIKHANVCNIFEFPLKETEIEESSHLKLIPFATCMQIKKGQYGDDCEQVHLTSDLVYIDFSFAHPCNSKLHIKKGNEDIYNFCINLKQEEISRFFRPSDRLISMSGPLFSWLFIRSGPLSHCGDMCHLHAQHKAIWK